MNNMVYYVSIVIADLCLKLFFHLTMCFSAQFIENKHTLFQEHRHVKWKECYDNIFYFYHHCSEGVRYYIRACGLSSMTYYLLIFSFSSFWPSVIYFYPLIKFSFVKLSFKIMSTLSLIMNEWQWMTLARGLNGHSICRFSKLPHHSSFVQSV